MDIPTIVASESFVHGTDYSIGNWTKIVLQGVSPKGYNTWPSIKQWNNTVLYERLENR
jgi:hypothetical protein